MVAHPCNLSSRGLGEAEKSWVQEQSDLHIKTLFWNKIVRAEDGPNDKELSQKVQSPGLGL